jgi:hypothetical protein
VVRLPLPIGRSVFDGYSKAKIMVQLKKTWQSDGLFDIAAYYHCIITISVLLLSNTICIIKLLEEIRLYRIESAQRAAKSRLYNRLITFFPVF